MNNKNQKVGQKELKDEEFNKSFKLFSAFVPDGIPLFSEDLNGTEKFIRFGENNLLPNYYLSLLNRSALHNAIVKDKAQIIGGNGFDKSNLSNAGYMFLQNAMNSKGMDMEEILARVSYDLEIFGAFSLNLIWNKTRTKILQVEHIDPEKIRIAKPDPKRPLKQDYYVCNDWANYDTWSGANKNDLVFLPGFSLTDRKSASTLLYAREYRPDARFYGTPEWMPGARWMELEYEISNFHLNNVKKGFAPSLFIAFADGTVPNLEEKQYLMAMMKEQYMGSRGTGEVMFHWARNKDSIPQITPIETNNNDKKFIEVTNDMRQGIINAHRITDPKLFGVGKEDGALFGQEDTLNALQVFQTRYVTPKQREIEKVFQRIANINGVPDKLTISEYTIKFTKTDLTVQDILAILGSSLTNESKIALLINSGYEESEATKLVGTGIVTPPPTI